MSDEEKKVQDVTKEADAAGDFQFSNEKSFQCVSPRSDWNIFVIAFLTAAITVVIYHFVMVAVDNFSKSTEPEYVTCACHINGDDEAEKEEKPRRKPRKHGKRRGKPGKPGKPGKAAVKAEASAPAVAK